MIHPFSWEITPWMSVKDVPSSQMIPHRVSTTAFRQAGFNPVESAPNWLTFPPAIALHGRPLFQTDPSIRRESVLESGATGKKDLGDFSIVVRNGVS
jgi:hypothetical protein